MQFAGKPFRGRAVRFPGNAFNVFSANRMLMDKPTHVRFVDAHKAEGNRRPHDAHFIAQKRFLLAPRRSAVSMPGDTPRRCTPRI